MSLRPLSESPRQLPALTGIRGIAATCVVLYHTYSDDHLPIIEEGYIGVDLFFVLSGFVLSYVYFQDERLTTARGYGRFLWLRLARVYPLHLASLFAILFVTIALPDFTSTYEPSKFSAGAFGANLLLIQNWGLYYQSWNVPSWSISAEWFAYLVFPLLILVACKISSRSVLVAMATAALGATIGLLYLAGYRDPNAPSLAGMVRMAGEFSCGVLLYAATRRGFRVPTFAGTVIVLVLCAVAILSQFVLLFAVALVIVLSSQEGSAWSGALRWKPILFLGEISYSIYMVHWIVLQLSNWSVRHDLVAHTFPLTGALTILTVLPLSIFTYRYIEIPARQWGRRQIGRSDKRAGKSLTSFAQLEEGAAVTELVKVQR